MMNKGIASNLECAVPMRGLNDSLFFETTAISNGDSYRIFVGAPLAMQAGQHYPVIYVLDGKLNFATVHAQSQLLSAMGQMPHAYVVGVAFSGDENFFAKDAACRQRDLTPNAGGPREVAMRELNDTGDTVMSGGSLAFLSFLRDELKPALESALPIAANDSTLLGNSLGGLFPSWVLFHQPEVFQRYVIVSPSWWWNDYEIWKWEEQYASGNDDLNAKVFVAAGGFETATRHRELIERMASSAVGQTRSRFDNYIAVAARVGWPRMAELIPEFITRLEARHYTHLELAAIVLPEETHESIAAGAFSRGLRFVFGSWRPDLNT